MVIKDLFENNLINWLLLVAVLVYFWFRITPAMFAARKDKIDAALREAEQAHKEGQQFLAQQRERIANAERESKHILDEARKMAGDMEKEVSAQAVSEANSLRERISQQINAEKQQAFTEMKSRAAMVAVRLAEAALPGAITDSARSRLLNQFIEQLESSGGKK